MVSPAAVAAGTLALLGADVTKAISDPPRLARHEPTLHIAGRAAPPPAAGRSRPFEAPRLG